MSLPENTESNQLQRYKHILSGSNIGTWQWNVQTGETIFNERWAEIIGYQLSELQPVTIDTRHNFVHPEDGERSEQLLNAHFVGETDSYVCEARMKHKDGHWVWVLDQGKVVSRTPDGKPEWVAGSHLDITALKHAELRLQISDNAFKESFQNAAVGMAILDTKGNWKEVNRTLCDILGYEESQLQKLTFQEITHPDDLDADLKLVRKLLKGEIPFYHMEKRYFHKSGRIVHAILAVSLVRDRKGEPLHFISQIIDISQRVSAERERLALLEITTDQNERLQNFAHVVTHDLRTHSGNIQALLQLIASEGSELSDHSHFELLQTASDNLEDTVQKLTDVARMNTTVAENLEPVRLKEVVESCVENTKSLAWEANVEISVRVGKEISVLALPAYLESIVLNLITNAVKYSSPERKSQVVISAEEQSDLVVLLVKDNGLGLDLVKNKNRLFRLNQTFHDHPNSRGVGLFITRNQIEAMGGRIEVESQLNVGSTFKVYLTKPYPNR